MGAGKGGSNRGAVHRSWRELPFPVTSFNPIGVPCFIHWRAFIYSLTTATVFILETLDALSDSQSMTEIVNDKGSRARFKFYVTFQELSRMGT